MSRVFPHVRNARVAVLFWLQLLFVLTTLFSRESAAQVVDPVTAAQTPVAGSGHHYIGMGAETVNPSDGSVSFDLPIQTPAGRQLSFPFGIRYNESSPFSLTNNGYSAGFNWITPKSNSMATPFDVNGWSYKLPTYQAQAFIAASYPVTDGCGDPNDPCQGSSTNYCWATQGYSFSGLDGASHVLYAGNVWPDPNNPQIVLASVCQNTSWQGFGGFAQGGAVGLATSIGSTPLGSSYQPPLTVTDTSGTVYQFSQGPAITVSPSVGVQPFGVLAQTITDRNGNQITLNGPNGVNGGNTLLSGSYTDTLGRSVVTWSGLGESSGDTITVSGLSNSINLKWTNVSVTFPSGSQQMIAPVATNATCELGNTQTSITIQVVSEIDLPNGQKYSFGYGNPYSPGSQWGRLSKITFPGGGYVRYVWGTNPLSKATYQQWPLDSQIAYAEGSDSCWAKVNTPAIVDRYVSYDGSTEVLHQHFQYATNWVVESNLNQVYWSSKTTTVTSTDLIANQTSVTTYTYSSVSPFLGPNDVVHNSQQNTGYNASGPTYMNWQTPQIPVEQTVLYQGGSGNTLKTVNKTWFDQYTMIGEQTILDNGQGMTTLRCPDTYDRILATYEYNFQSAGSKPSDPSCPAVYWTTSLSSGLNTTAIGPLLRQTVAAYHYFGSTNILDELDSLTVCCDSSGKNVKQTTYIYAPTAATTSGAKTNLVSPPGLRGNATSVSRWLNTNNSFLTTTYSYFDTGQVQAMTDPLLNATTYSYVDNPTWPAPQTNAYLTQVTYPNTGVQHQESFTWGFSDGLLRSHIDQNGQTITYCYLTGGCSGTVNDPLLRLNEVDSPDGGKTNYTYTDWLPTKSLPAQSSIAKQELENVSGTLITSNSVLDGMGHVVTTQATSDASGTDLVDSVYDGLGRVFSVSNPYRTLADPTFGVTTYGYDGLSRKTSQIDSDGVSTQIWSYSGASVSYTDENKNKWQRTTDALGRLSNILEPTAGSPVPSMETDYAYDLLDDLTSVNQWGGANGSPGSISRSFSYDSLSRLIQSFNPEAGWTCYGTTGGVKPNGSNCVSGYDANGNLKYKTDARTVVVSYTYDALNRLLSKSYSNDPSHTLSSCYQYDVSSVASSPAYLVGRLANQWTQGGACSTAPPTTGLWTRRSILAYDKLGRVLQEQQCTPSNCAIGTPYSPSYTYDLAGNVITTKSGITSTPGATTNPLTFTNLYDSSGRLQTLTSNWIDATHPATLFSAQTGLTMSCGNSSSAPYAPFGGLWNATYGNGLILNRAYDTRLRSTCETDTGSIVPTATSGSATVNITGMEQSK